LKGAGGEHSEKDEKGEKIETIAITTKAMILYTLYSTSFFGRRLVSIALVRRKLTESARVQSRAIKVLFLN
jgi:hypothetical protein